MKIPLREFKKDIEKYMDGAKNEPVIITKFTKSHSVLISYNIYKTLLEGAWAESALKYSDETTKEQARKKVEKEKKEKD